ncbi:MAG: hypothetical protein K2K12_00230, partial [Clostridia bacterium]|nr:hypothetical protein [Clostridia bacterium]
MKKIVSTLVAIVAAIACIAGLVACGGGKAEPVAGKTYEFEKVEITKGASGTTKDFAEAMMNQMFKNDYIEFGEDGTFVITMYGYAQSGTYTQSGSTITATLEGEDQTIKVSGDTVSMSGSAQGYSMKITYKLVKEETGTITSPVTEVAGTTFVFKDLEYKYADLISGDEQAQVEEMIAQLKTMYQGATIAFDDNGKYTMTVMGAEATTGTYTQNKAKVVMTGSDSMVITAAVSGNELTYDYLSMYT